MKNSASTKNVDRFSCIVGVVFVIAYTLYVVSDPYALDLVVIGQMGNGGLFTASPPYIAALFMSDRFCPGGLCFAIAQATALAYVVIFCWGIARLHQLWSTNPEIAMNAPQWARDVGTTGVFKGWNNWIFAPDWQGTFVVWILAFTLQLVLPRRLTNDDERVIDKQLPEAYLKFGPTRLTNDKIKEFCKSSNEPITNNWWLLFVIPALTLSTSMHIMQNVAQTCMTPDVVLAETNMTLREAMRDTVAQDEYMSTGKCYCPITIEGEEMPFCAKREKTYEEMNSTWGGLPVLWTVHLFQLITVMLPISFGALYNWLPENLPKVESQHERRHSLTADVEDKEKSAAATTGEEYI